MSVPVAANINSNMNTTPTPNFNFNLPQNAIINLNNNNQNMNINNNSPLKSPPETSLQVEMKNCLSLLQEFQNKKEAAEFLQAVDWKSLGLDDYPKIINQPMDLGTIEKKLTRNAYQNAYEFAEDMRLVWDNAKTFNRPGSEIYMTAENLHHLFERKFARIAKSGVGKRKNADKTPMTKTTMEQRCAFVALLKQVDSDVVGAIVEMLDKQCPQALTEQDDNEEVLAIEVYYIDEPTLSQCIAYCQRAIEKGKSNKKKNNK